MSNWKTEWTEKYNADILVTYLNIFMETRLRVLLKNHSFGNSIYKKYSEMSDWKTNHGRKNFTQSL